MRYKVGDRLDFWLKTVNLEGVPTEPDSIPTVQVIHLDTDIIIDLATTPMTQVEPTLYRHSMTAPEYVGTYAVNYTAIVEGITQVMTITFTVGNPRKATFWTRFINQDGSQASLDTATDVLASARYKESGVVKELFTDEIMAEYEGVFYHQASLPTGVSDTELYNCTVQATYEDGTVVGGDMYYQEQAANIVIGVGIDIEMDDDAVADSAGDIGIDIDDDIVMSTKESVVLEDDHNLTL